MKILFLCNEINLTNGWCVINYHTIKHAIEAGHDVTILTDHNAKNDPYFKNHVIPTLHSIGAGRSSFIKYVKNLSTIKKLIKENDFDYVQVLVEPYLIYFSFFRPKKLIFNLVGTYSVLQFDSKSTSCLYKLALRHVDQFISISDFTADHFKKYYPTKKSIQTIPLGVDNSNFGKLEVPKEKCFTIVGQVKPRKGHLYAIQAIEKLKVAHPDIKLYVIGDAETKYGFHCKKYVQDNNLEANVEFLGPIQNDQLKNYYAKSIANILPSVNTSNGHFEGFGLIHLEANACGIPSIGSYNCGNESAIVPELNGMLCEQESIEDITNKMLYYIEKFETNDYQAIQDKCMEYALINDWKNYGKKIQQAIL